MQNITVNLTSQTQPLGDIVIASEFKGFKFNNKLISVHHGNPIDTVKFGLESIPIHINSSWNELLILESEKQVLEIEPIKQFNNNIPKSGETLYLMYDNFKRIELTLASFEFISLNHFPTNPKVVYMKATMGLPDKNLESLSGSPILNAENKLVGIFCKQDHNSLYILPVYYINQTLKKIDNDSIYNVDYHEPIHKINKYQVVDGLIYHRALKIRIPLDCYYLLEGDKRKEILINNEIEQFYVKINELLPITNDRNIHEQQMNKIVVTTSLLILFKNINKESIFDVINFIKKNLGKKIYLSMNKRTVQSKNKMTQYVDINKVQYKFTFFTA